MSTVVECQATKIDEELSKIWESLEGSQKTWASLFNIIFFAQKGDNEEAFRSLVDLISKKYPCRSIIITENTEDPKADYLCIKVSSETIGEGELSVVCDQILIEVAGEKRCQIPFLILPHLLPDLPIYLIWTQDPTLQDPVFLQLKKYASKLIFDPRNAASLPRYAGTLLAQVEERPTMSGVADLGWILTSGLRELMGMIFCTQELIDQLCQAKIIRVGYSNGTSKETHLQGGIQALYLQAWIAAQLNWKCNDLEEIEGNIRISYKHLIDETVALLIPEHREDVPQGLVTYLEIHTTGHHHFLFKRIGGERRVRAWVSSLDRCEIPFEFNFSRANQEQLIVGELFEKGTSQHFIHLLQLLSHLNRG